MEKEHEAHLERIKQRFGELAQRKYEVGQKEHGGKLWEKQGLLDEAINEALDLFIYLSTLKEQEERQESAIRTEVENVLTEVMNGINQK